VDGIDARYLQLTNLPAQREEASRKRISLGEKAAAAVNLGGAQTLSLIEKHDYPWCR
jgi:hypothetical protein